MRYLEPVEVGELQDPLGIVESLAAVNNWDYEREDDEVAFEVEGTHGYYKVSFVWVESVESLQLACTFAFNIPKRRLSEIHQLIALINAKLPPIGHFEVWPRDGALIFRHGLSLAGGTDAGGKQCEVMLQLAIEACERYFPAFQYVVWAGKPPAEAMRACLFDTVGEA